MNREEFYNYIKDNLKSNLSEELRNGECVLSQVSKNNQMLTGVTIRPNESGMQITPVVYLDNFYDRYESGYAAHEILNDIARIYENYAARSNSNDFSFKPDMVMDYNAAKDHIYPKVIGISGNETYLQDKVYRTIEDLAVTYYIDLSEDLNSIGGKPTVTISKTILEKYGVTEEEINKQALDNQSKKGYELINLFEMLNQMMGMDGPIPEDGNITYVLNNPDKINGAALIADNDILKEVADKIGTDEFYILPSSIHEVLIMPGSENIDTDYLKNMVSEVNATTVNPADRLSDNVYHFDARNKELSVAEDDKEETLF